MYISIYLSISLSLYIYIYIYMYGPCQTQVMRSGADGNPTKTYAAGESSLQSDIDSRGLDMFLLFFRT